MKLRWIPVVLGLAIATPASAQSTGAGFCKSLDGPHDLTALVMVHYDENAQPDPAGGYSIQVSRHPRGQAPRNDGVLSLDSGDLIAIRWDNSGYSPALEVRTAALDAASQYMRLWIDKGGPGFLTLAEIVNEQPSADGAEWENIVLDECRMMGAPVRVR
jgi:hypothetical protein